MQLEGQIRIPSGCAIAAVISKEGKKMSGKSIVDSMVPMHERSNGLGGGFAGYGIYPEYKDFYAFHFFFAYYVQSARYFETSQGKSLSTESLGVL